MRKRRGQSVSVGNVSEVACVMHRISRAALDNFVTKSPALL